MASERKYEDLIEEVKSSGGKAKETIETATEMARIIGELSEARIRLGLTQRQLAEKTGLKQSAIARMESLQTIPRLDTLIRVANSLNVKIDIAEDSTRYSSMAFGIAPMTVLIRPNIAGYDYKACLASTVVNFS